MSRLRAPSRLFSIISPLFPFYVLGVLPGQVLWPIIFLPLIVLLNYIWDLVLATGMIVAMGQTEKVGQRMLVRYALWAMISGLIIDIAHDVTLAWLSQRVDFLLQAQPWRLLGTTYLVPCLLIFAYNFLLSWQYLRLSVWRAAIMGLAFALLTAPWTTLVLVDYGQGRMSLPAQRLLWLGLLVLALTPLLLAAGSRLLQRLRGAGRMVGAAVLVAMTVLVAAAGAKVWTAAAQSPATSMTRVSVVPGELAFTTRQRLYAVRSASTPVQALGHLQGNVILWSPNERLLLTNEEQADGTAVVTVRNADSDAPGRVVGNGVAGAGAWSPDSSSIVYVTPTDAAGIIHVVNADGSKDRLLAEGRSPSWSADGRRIAFSARTGGRWQVWVMLPSGADPIQLTTDGGEDPIWSPDGRFIAYVLNNRVQVMDADGSNKRRLAVDNAFADVRPVLSWASDGSRLAYAYIYPPESGRPTQLYVWDTTMPATPLGSALPPLTTPTATTGRGLVKSGDFRPPFGWSPDGAWLGFLRRGDLWTLNVRTGEEQRLLPADSFAWGGRPVGMAVRPVPTYPPTPTPTPLPPAVVESPSVLVLEPKDPNIILAGTASGVVKKSGSGGWFLSSSGINPPTQVRTIAYDPSDNSVLYAGTDGQRAIAGTLYKSIDGGTRWLPTGLKDVDIYFVLVDPRQSRTIYAGTSKGVYVSSDGGANWVQRNNGLKTTAVLALALDTVSVRSSGLLPGAQSGPVLYLGTRQGEIYKTTNGGGDWKLVQAVNVPVTRLVIYPQKTVTIFATTSGGLFSSADDGETWNQVSGGIWQEPLDGLVLSAKDTTIYAHGVQGVFVSHDGGVNWGPASNGLEGTQPSALAAHPTDAGILYVGTDKGMFRTANGGVTWVR